MGRWPRAKVSGLLVLVGGLALSRLGSDLLRRIQREPPAGVPMLVVDPNLAPYEVLLALPTVGPVLAETIVNERNRRPFESIQDFDDRVEGVGPSTLTALRPHLRFDSP